MQENPVAIRRSVRACVWRRQRPRLAPGPLVFVQPISGISATFILLRLERSETGTSSEVVSFARAMPEPPVKRTAVINLRHLALVTLGGAAMVCGQVAMAIVLPPLGAVFFLITIAFLEAIEGRGISTLQGSPDGWPIPTQLGWCYAVAIWWIVWSATLALVIWRRSHRSLCRDV